MLFNPAAPNWEPMLVDGAKVGLRGSQSPHCPDGSASSALGQYHSQSLLGGRPPFACVSRYRSPLDLPMSRTTLNNTRPKATRYLHIPLSLYIHIPHPVLPAANLMAADTAMPIFVSPEIVPDSSPVPDQKDKASVATHAVLHLGPHSPLLVVRSSCGSGVYFVRWLQRGATPSVESPWSQSN